MAPEEDFSFPTTTDTPPRFIESPRLWRTTSLVSSTPETPISGDAEDFNFLYFASKKPKSKSVQQRKSFSHVECRLKNRGEDGNHCSDGDDDQEDKMDMLWEDFNEEFSRNSNSSSRAGSDHHHHRMPSGKMLNFGCAQATKLSRPNKKPSTADFMKVLKKMFSLQNSHRSVKRTQW